jgi:peptidylprolyl isomerase
MRSVLRVAIALAAAAVTACSPPAQTTDAVSTTDATPEVSTSTDADDSSADAAPALAWGCTLPNGYSQTPFFSDEAMWEFTAPEMVLTPAIDYVALIDTDVGTITLDLFENVTPITVNSFVFLARNHYFDGIAFHRVIEGFVAQGGDPNTLGDFRASWGSGGPGYGFGLEIVDSLHYDAAGVVGMARGDDPNSNGSQFFITLAPTPSLDGMYTIFARVIAGSDVVPRIARNMTADQPPAVPTRMTRVCIAQRPMP